MTGAASLATVKTFEPNRDQTRAGMPQLSNDAGNNQRSDRCGFSQVRKIPRDRGGQPLGVGDRVVQLGEMFLNPDIERIIEYAYRRNVRPIAWNGANFNHVGSRSWRAMVRYKFRAITCSIDGASSKVYERYRVNGDFGRVIDNIRKLNAHKRRWKSRYPKLCWQMVVFGTTNTRSMRRAVSPLSFGMSFVLKTNWDESYSPLQDERPGMPFGDARLAETSVDRDELLSDGICHSSGTSRRSTSTGRCSAAA